MASNYFFVTLPTQPYIARFISIRYKQIYLYPNNNTRTGSHLLNLLANPPINTQLSVSRKNFLFNLYTENFKISANLELKNKIVADPSPEHIILINQFLKELFDMQLAIFCHGYVNHENRFCGYTDAIETFARIYQIQIERDVTFECLKQSEYRFRKKIGDNWPKYPAIKVASRFIPS